MGLVKNTFLVLAMTQTTNLSLGNEPTGVAFPSDPFLDMIEDLFKYKKIISVYNAIHFDRRA